MKRLAIAAFLGGLLALPAAVANEPGMRTVKFRFTPTKRAQIALWIERADGTFLQTIMLTQATGTRGIGNRPGASQMNSGFRWPYGRREGVLPVWAHRRAAAPGASSWKRVIFQNRRSEGDASRSVPDASKDDYFCLSFKDHTSKNDGFDAVSCASAFTSDKGRFITAADVANGYAEPQENAGEGTMKPLSLESLYPPRRDVVHCKPGMGECIDHPDVDLLRSEAERVMPDLDTVSAPTPPPETPTEITFHPPLGWPDGEYVAWIEVDTEADFNTTWNDQTYPTPLLPDAAWDVWARTYGYPFRGQPSIVFKLPFTLGGDAQVSAKEPIGYGSLSGDGLDGATIHPMDGAMSNDPTRMPGSGADRLRLVPGSDFRFQVETLGEGACTGDIAPEAPRDFTALPYPGEKHSHEWGHMSFTVPHDDGAIGEYEVRVGTQPIVDEPSFKRAMPANGATLESERLMVPTGNPEGARVSVDFGGLAPQTHYWVGIRALDTCGTGPIAVAELTTTPIHFTKLSGCFIATAAWGTPVARQIDALRHVRDRHLVASPVGRGAVAIYEDVGPVLADRIAGDDALRALVRSVLAPVAEVAGTVERVGGKTTFGN